MIMVKFLLSFIFIILLFSCQPQDKRFDVVILNGQIIDGTGNPGYYGDIGIKAGKIVKIGNLKSINAQKVIDAKGYIVTPGFIDVHTHTDKHIDSNPDAINYIHQGVTTIVGGNCGKSRYPLKQLFDTIEQKGIAINFASFTGHNTIRREVMRDDNRDPTPEELKQMQELIAGDMKAGAIGMSTGLTYVPGRFAKKRELVELAGVIHTFHGIYASHTRSEGKKIESAITEAIHIGREAKIPVQISHIKLANEIVWGQYQLITDQIESARQRGLQIYIDQYPYIATSTGFSGSFPRWAVAGGHESLLQRLQDPKKYQKIKNSIIRARLTSLHGLDMLSRVYIASNENHPEYEGKNLKQILTLLGRETTVSNAADLIIEMEKNDQPRGIYFKMLEKDVRTLMRLSYTMIASDGDIQKVGVEMPHPRSYGTFPRVLGRYVREQNVLSLPDAIRKMTSLPAQAMGFFDRGVLRPGAAADITIFDAGKINDTATFDKPHQFPVGILWVMVNGEVVIAEGKRTGAFPGKVIYGSGYSD